MLVASGASPAVAAGLTELGAKLSQAPAADSVVDVVPASAKDPHGAAFTSMALPLVLSSLVGGVLITQAVPRLRDRATALGVFAIGGGAALAGLAGHLLAFLPGSYLGLTAAIGTTTLAVAGLTSGAGSLLGRRGFGLTGATMMLLANPLSGAAAAPELLPAPWGALGQDLPAGAGATLIRDTASSTATAPPTPSWS